ncbi:hypothetical protein CC117_30210 [Parafrankia colletiae]|uniref:Bacterial transcriptional activator domain-containing protein n=1 Tax=Parafrankia colletiae TaxID=573497 RepID=A0A1S1Q3U2_9ACTN|nr:hypothetical protein CC117_30210 [Parafrankia colletiae]
MENFRLSLCDELRETLLACLQGELLLSRHNQVIAEITDLRRTHPLDERVAALAMMANYRAGRQDEALHVYTEIHAALADEIAGEPGPELRELQQRILRGDDTLRAAGPAARLSPASNPDERRRPTMSDDPNPNRGTAEATGREAGPDAGLDPAALAMRVAVSLAHASQDQPEPGAPVARLVQLVHTRTAGDVRATGALARLARRPDKRNALFLVRDLLVPLLAADAAFAAQADELAPHTMPAVRDRAAISMRARKIDIGKQVVFEEEVKVKGNFSF